jgi:hypothetical protein
MIKPCFSIEEFILLLHICDFEELSILQSVILDDYTRSRYSTTDFKNMWILIDKRLTSVRYKR